MRFLLILASFTLLFSCASEKPTGKTEAEILYKEALKCSEFHFVMFNQKGGKTKIIK